jgi:hypothetical protein
MTKGSAALPARVVAEPMGRVVFPERVVAGCPILRGLFVKCRDILYTMCRDILYKRARRMGHQIISFRAR